MKTIHDIIERTSPLDSSVLISGETGTGKELVARAFHERSLRKDGPFVAINCAAIPESILESELFGYVKGAFSDAKANRKGLFAEAHEGTLFLDEIGDMPLMLQGKILRALQERRVRPLGSNEETLFDARIISATNRDLETLCEEGRFRQDLYFRLHVLEVNLPSLRMRGNDILLLAHHFLRSVSKRLQKNVTSIAPSAAEKLLAYGWPGNVRELENSIERATALTSFNQLMLSDLPDKIQNAKPAQVLLAGDDPADLVTLEEVEGRYILRVLEAAGQNKVLAAKILGLDRKTLYRKLDKYLPK